MAVRHNKNGPVGVLDAFFSSKEKDVVQIYDGMLYFKQGVMDMKITTSLKENQKQYLTKRHGNEPGLYLSNDGDNVWIVNGNGSVVGFFGLKTSLFHSVAWDDYESRDNDHVAYCKIYHAPKDFELKILQ